MIYTKTLNEGDECYIWVGDINSVCTFAGRIPPLIKLRATFRNDVFITPNNEIYDSSVWKFTKIHKKIQRVKRTHENTSACPK